MSFLAIDIGNTRLKWALFDTPQPHARLLEHGAVFLENIERLADQDWAHLEAPGAILGCCVASDAVRRRVVDQAHELWETPPRWIVPNAQEADVANGYEHPSRLGADRWVAMIGAHDRMRRNGPIKPLIVAMVGTAVTVDALDAHGRFVGGLILPGHGIMLRALSGGTAGLRVPTGDVRHFPCNTSDALTSGGTYAITGAIERLHRNLHERTGEIPHCVIAGGAGWKVAPYLGIKYELIEALLFEGLLVLAEQRKLMGLGAQEPPPSVY
jgi:type III pantothenate kinase